ncbi:M50 family metallopeptidase [Cytobacillus purgationiresistens]|uniref:Stage IV sporulation protein FB n=1 Tax=Cytobacillus purgationiresistens TaxID=863449 RepID=A0ABU0AF75_9BACI|nr:M50 family metallopeptidase [Cytobacillus purgationiresistens]MDQ0269903.1 stage IV sporulation protein FB [Cytobacillus purgationiresistens]
MIKLLNLFRQIQIHPLLWVVMGLAIITAHFMELSLLLLIIFIHEMGHAAAAALFSWRIKRIVLLPFGGVAEMDEHGNRPLKEEVIVILSGPLQHVWMIAAAFIAYEFSWISTEMFTLFFQFNLMILFFNLLPLWPLDGGKLVFLLLSYRYAFPVAHRKTLLISAVGLVIFFLFILITTPLNINIWIILAFLIFSLYYEWKQGRYVFMRFLLERHYGKNSDFRTLKPLVVKEEDAVIDVLEKFQRGCKHSIIVENRGSEKGSLDENELLHAYFSDKILTAKIGDLVYIY